MTLRHMPGIVNPADDQTKPLGCVSHSCKAHDGAQAHGQAENIATVSRHVALIESNCQLVQTFGEHNLMQRISQKNSILDSQTFKNSQCRNARPVSTDSCHFGFIAGMLETSHFATRKTASVKSKTTHVTHMSSTKVQHQSLPWQIQQTRPMHTDVTSSKLRSAALGMSLMKR